MSKSLYKLSFVQTVWLLSKRELVFKKRLLITSGVIYLTINILLYLLSKMFVIIDLIGLSLIMTTGFLFLEVAGPAFTSIIFEEMNKKEKATLYFTLPVSNLEKFCAAWFVSFGVYITIFLSFVVTYSVFSGTHNESLLFFFTRGEKIDLLWIINKIWILTGIHSIFLFGAVYFKANQFLSTILSFFGIFLMFSIILFLFDLNGIFPKAGLTIFSSLTVSDISEILSIVLVIVFNWLTFQKLKNRELSQ